MHFSGTKGVVVNKFDCMYLQNCTYYVVMDAIYSMYVCNLLMKTTMYSNWIFSQLKFSEWRIFDNTSFNVFCEHTICCTVCMSVGH